MGAKQQADDPDSRIAACLHFGAATLHEAAGQIGALPSPLHCMTPGLPLVGAALPVACPPGDNAWLHRAIYEATPGEVLVVQVAHSYEWGYWGEVLSCAAAVRKLGGVVIDGCVRDIDRLAVQGVPVFARGASIRGTAKHANSKGSIGAPVVLGDVVVSTGDWVVGDTDGIVVIPAELLDETIELAMLREAKEEAVFEALRRGERTIDIYQLSE